MQYEGPRRQGRFIKNGSKVMEKVALINFSFKEINDAKVITLDNAKRSILHTSFHGDKALGEAVHSADRFNDELISRDGLRSVIFPTDFTKEWERDKKLRKDRVSRHDDEDFDYELEAARLKEEQDDREAKAQDDRDAAGAETVAPAATVPASPAQPAAPTVAKFTPPPVNQWESMSVVGKAIRELVQPGDVPDVVTTGKTAVAQADAARAEEFIPSHTATTSGQAPVDPEAQASEDYKARLEALKVQESQLQELVDEAKSRGYREGIRLGEEKAELQARQHANQLFGKVSELLGEFGNLKQEVLNNVQENFYELCQAMAESLIKREFSIHPDAFVTILRRAIAEAVEPGQFKVKVNPETYDHVASLGSSDILEALVRDKDVPVGDFKIESQMSVVNVNVTKMIADLLQQADLTLFNKDKAG